ncbi:MAG: CDP-diacylglycerol--glycerol-3-phosphate 3-phosphatidyltransferase [Myxococcales bacterium]|nr:MAG: CDP-diacylglycerol--glycerol-3-phosphate 3-phosphatidyltransferase [Myxococcales bacterium]
MNYPGGPVSARGLRNSVLNLPNLLTILRIVVIPFVLWLLYSGTPKMCFWAAFVYTLAVITDALDGWLARKYGIISILGKFLDPLAGKLIVMAMLVVLVDMQRAPAWLVVVIVARELAINALRSIAAGEGIVMAAGRGGKDKTALQMVGLLLLILHYPYDLYFGFTTVSVDLHQVGLVIMYVSVVFAVMSAAEYMTAFSRAVRTQSET